MRPATLLALLAPGTLDVPQADAGDPFAMLADAGSPLFVLAMLLPVAVMVFWFGSRRFAKERNGGSLRPRGRVLFETSRQRDEAWRATVRRLESKDPMEIASATKGPARFEGVLVNASGNLGGRPGAECVWRNRAGGRADAAVGAEVVILQGKTGACGIEGIERAYIIAPSEKHTFHHENVSLYLGDHVEVYGHFDPDSKPDTATEAPSHHVYGTLSFDTGLDVRLTKRPVAEPADVREPTPSSP